MDEKPKNKLVEREKEILAQWQKKGIFEKTLQKKSPKGEYIFYEGPPTANGEPHLGHLEARAFKDAIPRYKTMRGFHVRRKGGWDTHGLPVELAVEKELGLKSKKEIEKYGIAAFNERCKESVWKYVHEWEEFTRRMGYWVDLKDPYITYKNSYIESLWNIIKTASGKKLLYKDYKVVPWCPRCQTGLSSHELAQGYEDVKDLSVYVKFQITSTKSQTNPKFKIPNEGKTYLLAWTTTPWTLPGNVALAVGERIEYIIIKNVKIKNQNDNSKLQNGADDILILAKDRVSEVLKNYDFDIIEELSGAELIGLEYEPLYPFTKEHISGAEKEKLANAYKVYAADFVTTEDGTGIVHTAVMYGQDDFELGTKIGLPKHHLVNEDGTFKKEAGFLAGKFVKDEATDVEIIKDLASRDLLFAKEKYQHSYPFCWRCHTPLIYFARDSWYIKMSALRETLVKENEKIHWEPEHIKEGRFGEWLHEVKDWAISRERYWGTPLPIWQCNKCQKQRVVGSIYDIEGRWSGNRFFLVRHGESENNLNRTLNSDRSKPFKLTDTGKDEARETGRNLKGRKIDMIFASPFPRTKETAEIIADTLGFGKGEIKYDERIVEIGLGDLEGITVEDYSKLLKNREDYFTTPVRGIETRLQIKARVASFLEELDTAYQGKNILIVSHEAPIWMMVAVADGLDIKETLAIKKKGVPFIENAEAKEIIWRRIPRNRFLELDLHRPYIDSVKLACENCAHSTGSGRGGEMARVKEVMDVWFDSGAMPFAQDAGKRGLNADNQKGIFQRLIRASSAPHPRLLYPADFICEAIDQTRGWFYTLHAIGAIMGKGKAYKNVVCLGHILDAEGKKMSKSVGNVVDPFLAMEKYGADPLRFWMYSVNQPGESKNFDERTVDEVVKKVFNPASNVLAFYQLYATPIEKAGKYKPETAHVLDRWIVARLNQLTKEVTESLENYKFLEPTRAIRDFIADLSQWYIRRSRNRFKEHDANIRMSANDTNRNNDKEAALATTRFVLLELSRIMAPFTPFFAEHLYSSVGAAEESVHLEDWPEWGTVDETLIEDMTEVRKIVSIALEARAKSNVKVRQPLAKLKVKSKKLKADSELLALVADEVNVKEVLVDEKLANDVELDTNITSELKEEGELREIIRTIQELRKTKGLKAGELAVLATSATFASNGVLKKFESEIKKSASLSSIELGTFAGEGEMGLRR